ncbi:MAG: 50S ribosomal protein L11 methyltransferase [Bacteroides sp.]
MRYYEITFTTNPCTETINDVLSAELGTIAFESFVECEHGIKAYIPEKCFNEEILAKLLKDYPMSNVSIQYKVELMEDKNWNEEWEKNYFQPIVIGDRCVIHSTFHTNIPAAQYDILINPQMAFGTGHHETTSLILTELLDANLKDKSLLDMGCGTSILAILAAMRGAKPITAIDIDTWCVSNSKDNILLNKVENIEVELGDANALKGREPFDIIIANINRNILLADMKQYVSCMKQNSEIYMSGFYETDLPFIKEEAESCGLQFIYHKVKNNWTVGKFILK